MYKTMTDANKLLTKEEDIRIDYLMKVLQRIQLKEAEVKKELRALVYKIERI